MYQIKLPCLFLTTLFLKKKITAVMVSRRAKPADVAAKIIAKGRFPDKNYNMKIRIQRQSIHQRKWITQEKRPRKQKSNKGVKWISMKHKLVA